MNVRRLRQDSSKAVMTWLTRVSASAMARLADVVISSAVCRWMARESQ